jgi:sterol desaturase/sphingolipid hydroxylase (fatty acid hydroxylase superfamily)
MDYFFDYTSQITNQFIDPKKRVFLFYILISILIAAAWFMINKKLSLKKTLIKIFDKKIFFSKSAKSDYKIFLINQLIMMIVSPFLITQLTIATALYFYFHTIEWLSAGMFVGIAKIYIILSFTIFQFTIDDFSKYIVHRFMHKWPVLWALHKVHHSATVLTPMTVFRTHPLEGIIFSLRSAITQAIGISLFFYLFGNLVSLYTIVGVNVFVFVFNILGSNLRHSHIGIRYWKWLEYIFISPAQHQLHHSVAFEHHDKNFGAALAVWDWLFGSLHHSVEFETLHLGITKDQKETTHNLKNLYLDPIHEIKKHIFNKIKKIKNKFNKLILKGRYINEV